MLHSEQHNHNPKIKQTRQFFPSPEQFDFWGYVFITYHPRNANHHTLCMALKLRIDRETGSRSRLDNFHLKQTVQKIIHWFLELYRDFV